MTVFSFQKQKFSLLVNVISNSSLLWIVSEHCFLTIVGVGKEGGLHYTQLGLIGFSLAGQNQNSQSLYWGIFFIRQIRQINTLLSPLIFIHEFDWLIRCITYGHWISLVGHYPYLTVSEWGPNISLATCFNGSLLFSSLDKFHWLVNFVAFSHWFFPWISLAGW